MRGAQRRRMCVIMRVTEPATAPSGLPWAGFSNSHTPSCVYVCVSLSPLRPFLFARALRRPAYGGRNVAVTCGASPADGGVLAPNANQNHGIVAFRNKNCQPIRLMGRWARHGGQKRSDHVAGREKRQDPIPFAWLACVRNPPPPPSVRVLCKLCAGEEIRLIVDKTSARPCDRSRRSLSPSGVWARESLGKAAQDRGGRIN